MLPEAKSEDLIYVASGPTAVLSYSTGKLVGTIAAGYEGVCSDRSGNVFFVGANNAVVEYSHGGTTPVATLYLPGSSPSAIGCASDPITGNLAVTYYTFGSQGSGENVAVFPDAQGTPTVYQSGIGEDFCTYDDKGNLFVDGILSDVARVAELPSGGSSFTVFTIDKGVGGDPWSIVWDGKYLSVEGVLEHSVTFSRIEINGSTATVVGVVRIRGKIQHITASWLFGNVLLIPFAHSSSGKIGFWKYPKGGKAIEIFTQKTFGQELQFPQGLAVSVAPSS